MNTCQWLFLIVWIEALCIVLFFALYQTHKERARFWEGRADDWYKYATRLSDSYTLKRRQS
jgi:hypothetical protein